MLGSQIYSDRRDYIELLDWLISDPYGSFSSIQHLRFIDHRSKANNYKTPIKKYLVLEHLHLAREVVFLEMLEWDMLALPLGKRVASDLKKLKKIDRWLDELKEEWHWPEWEARTKDYDWDEH